MTLEEALAEIDVADSDKDISYTKLAEKHSVWRSTLSRRDQGIHASRVDDALNRRLMHPPRDEEELVQYIVGLAERHLMPTRQMIKNFATPIVKKEPGDSWVTRFLNAAKIDSSQCGRPPWTAHATSPILVKSIACTSSFCTASGAIWRRT